jgi:hypothetical protein
VQVQIKNIYLRGNTRISSAGIGCNSAIENSGVAHYGTTPALATGSGWTFTQFYHTFIGSTGDNRIVINLGSYVDETGGSVGIGLNNSNYYSDLTGKLLPNHIHLCTNASTSSAVAYPGDYDSGPFLDQLIHAKYSITFDSVWVQFRSVSTTQPLYQGFVGKFGSNGHNATKTRGVLLGNAFFDPEGAAVVMGVRTKVSTIFVKAGVIDYTALGYSAGSADWGEGNPSGDNPVITTRDNGSTTLDLNLGARSWRAGTSPRWATSLRNNIAI